MYHDEASFGTTVELPHKMTKVKECFEANFLAKIVEKVENMFIISLGHVCLFKLVYSENHSSIKIILQFAS